MIKEQGDIYHVSEKNSYFIQKNIGGLSYAKSNKTPVNSTKDAIK